MIEMVVWVVGKVGEVEVMAKKVGKAAGAEAVARGVGKAAAAGVEPVWARTASAYAERAARPSATSRAFRATRLSVRDAVHQ